MATTARLACGCRPGTHPNPYCTTYFGRRRLHRTAPSGGAIESEFGSTITLAQADGNRIVVGRDEFTTIKNPGVSRMPEGIEAVLSSKSMADLLAFLCQTP